MLIQNAELQGNIVDVRIEAGVVVAIGSNLENGGSSFAIDAERCALIPGLVDHHIHMNASAAALNSVFCGPAAIGNAAELIDVLHRPYDGDEIRGFGYHESVAGEIDRFWLDENGPARPVRIQHRSGRLWIVNSLALEALGVDAPNDGRLYDSDQIVRETCARLPDLGPLEKKLLSFGVVGVTETTPSNGAREYEHYTQSLKHLQICVMGGAGLGSVNGAGPLKLHYHDNNLPSLGTVISEIETARRVGRLVAIHCVTRAELMLALAAFEEAGALVGDRIEHAALAEDYAVEWIERLGLTVVTQPNFIVERAEAYLHDVPQDELPFLWRLRSFDEAGVPMAFGCDAPFGRLNPWAAMAAAVKRPVIAGQSEEISPEQALAFFSKPLNDAGATPRKINVGEPADLCLLDRPWLSARDDLSAIKPVATWVKGDLAYKSKAFE